MNAILIAPVETIRTIPLIARTADEGISRHSKRVTRGLFAAEAALALPVIAAGIQIGVLRYIDPDA